jgi:hypothetical protein
MRSHFNWLAGTILASVLVCLTSGCGGGVTTELAKPPDIPPGSPPPLSTMPGADPKTGSMMPQPAAK